MNILNRLKKFILFFIVINEFLYGTAFDEFNDVIKSSKLNNNYYPVNFSFDDIDNNQTQREKKRLIEELIPFYLATENIFLKERLEKFASELMLQELKDESPFEVPKTWKDEGFLAYENELRKHYSAKEISYYGNFFKLLNSYLKYLALEDEALFDTLSEKALLDVQKLIKNSQNTHDYMTGMIWLKMLYSSIENATLLKKYPPPSKNLFEEKLIYDKEKLLFEWKPSSVKERRFPNKKMNKEIRERVEFFYKIFKKELDTAYAEYIRLLKENSEKKLKDFEKQQKRIYIDLSSKKQTIHLKAKMVAHMLVYVLSGSKQNLFVYKLQKELDEAYNESVGEKSMFSYWFYLFYLLISLFVLYLLWLIYVVLHWFFIEKNAQGSQK